MRIAIISHTYVVNANRGKLACLSSSSDVELCVVIPQRWVNRDTGFVIEAESDSDTRYQLKVLAAWPTGFGSLVTYSPVALYRVLRAFRPDLLYMEEEPWSMAAFEAALLSKLLRIPFVFFTWENLDRALPTLSRIVRRVVTRVASGAIAGNREAAHLLSKWMPSKPILVSPQLGVDQQIFFPKDSVRSSTDFVIGYVGRLVPQKGIMLLLEATARLQGTRLLIVGRGPLKGAIIASARRLGILSRVEIREDARHQDVPQHLRTMSVLVLPSLTTNVWKEQFGHVLIEAMACGIPVVGADSGAIPEVIADGGLVVGEGSAEALEVALRRLRDEPGFVQTLRSKGLARVGSEYTNEVIASKAHGFLVSFR